jgi:hypothetical protein
MRTLRLRIDASERACRGVDSTFCDHLELSPVGQEWFCRLFQQPLVEDSSEEAEGPLRCKGCLAAEEA